MTVRWTIWIEAEAEISDDNETAHQDLDHSIKFSTSLTPSMLRNELIEMGVTIEEALITEEECRKMERELKGEPA